MLSLAISIFLIFYVGTLMVVSTTYFIMKAIALFKIAQNAGHPYAWFAFIPVLQTHLLDTLPLVEFNLFNWIKTKNRSLVSIIYIIADSTLLYWISCIPIIGFLVRIVRMIFVWKFDYDLLVMLGKEDNAMLFSILGLFVPFLFPIVLLAYSGSEPDYGFGNYTRFSEEFKQ